MFVVRRREGFEGSEEEGLELHVCSEKERGIWGE